VNPPNPSLSLLPAAGDPATARKPAAGDYFLIDYNAASRQTFWFDYHHWYDPGARDENIHQIIRNGSFLPVVYTREKIAVHVCNLHFTDQLTVTTSPLAVPEGGADIRGYTSTTPLTALTNTLDILQTGTTTGGVTPESGLGFAVPTAATAAPVVSGVAPGSLAIGSAGPTYTSATITASGEQLALMMFAFRKNADALADSIATMTQTENGPGSITSINAELLALTAKIAGDAGGPDAVTDAAGFDEDMTAVQGVSAQLTTLAGVLTAQAFGSRAVTLHNNYAVLRGILDFVDEGFAQHNCQPPPPGVGPVAVLPPVPALTPAMMGQLTPDQVAHMTIADLAGLTSAQVQGLTSAQLVKLSNPQIQALLGPHPQIPPSGADQPACSAFEHEKFVEFRAAYENELIALGQPSAAVFNIDARDSRAKMFDALQDLKQDLQSIDSDTGNIFTLMNNWYQISTVEQTDLITPVNNNTLERISIIVQRGYTPFTLANNPAATTTVAAIAPAAAAATTSTPAHSVKTILVEVHRIANFNLAGGIMILRIPNKTYSIQASPTPATPSTTNSTGWAGNCGGATVVVTPAPLTSMSSVPYSSTNPPTYACVVQTQQTNWQVAGMVGLTWYPWGRDYFPLHSGFTSYHRNLLPSLLIASSITSLGSAMGAVNWEPIGGIDIFAGVGSANRNALPAGLAANTAVTPGYTLPSITLLHAGLALGIAFDIGTIAQLFSAKVGTAPGMP